MFKFFKSRASKESSSHEVLAKLEQARSLNQQGQFHEAASICRAILELQADHVDTLMLSAEIAGREHNPGQAIELYSRITRLKPKYGMAHYKCGNVLKDSGQPEAALASYDQAIALDPRHANAFCNRGAVLEHLSRWDEALASYNQALALNPADAFAYYNRGTLLRRLGRAEEALASLNQAITAKPDYAEALFNSGTLLRELQRPDEALACYEKVIEISPGFSLAHLRRGALLGELKQSDAALASYDKAIELDPRFAEAYGYRGVLLQGRNQLDAALASYTKAIELDPRFAEAYYNRGVLHQQANRSEAAVADYDKAIELVPHFAEAFANRAALFHARKLWDSALASYDKAIELDPNYAGAFLSRGAVLMAQERWNEALASLDRAIALSPASADAHNDRGDVLEQLMQPVEAMASFDRALALRPGSPAILRRRTGLRMSVCDWRELHSDIERITTEIKSDLPLSVAPLMLAALLDEPSLQHRAARIWTREEYPSNDALGAIELRPRKDKIRVGYYSPDFRSHPVAGLTADLFEFHDRSRFEITAFAFGPAAADPMRKRLERAFDSFIDVRDRSDLEVAALSRELGIDVAVDLAGFTAHCRTEIFALRAAPIQLSYIGYLGTMGAPYMDYLIADVTIIPPASQGDYSEKIIYLPSYQVNSKREISNRRFTRQELGLSPQGFVFSCFNTLYKLQPATFESWMRILRRVPDSTLFIYGEDTDAKQNLLNAARRSAVATDRVVFGTRIKREEYLARFRTMDLFLDTWPYNAGTTASDALWAGLPVLTCAGRSFASRYGASLLNALDLPELITENAQQYEDLAVELATRPERLQEIRQKLADHRNSAPLFDTRSFAGHLESAFEKICEQHRAGLPAEHVYV
jgi:predicted O-linked N-acetylglucosamine transferase (SPINDLY family)